MPGLATGAGSESTLPASKVDGAVCAQTAAVMALQHRPGGRPSSSAILGSRRWRWPSSVKPIDEGLSLYSQKGGLAVSMLIDACDASPRTH